MQKQYALLLLTLFSTTCPIIAADDQLKKREYDPAKTEELQQLAQQISEFTKRRRIAPGVFSREWEDGDPLQYASQIIALVCNGANPNVFIKDEGITLLRCYVNRESEEVVRCLLEYNGDPNIPWKAYDQPPLFAAKSYNMVKLLLDGGANALYRSSHYNNSALHHAAVYGGSAEVLAALCQAGLHPNDLNQEGVKHEYNSMSIELANWSSRKSPDTGECRKGPDHMKQLGVLYWYGADIEQENGKGENYFDEMKKYDPKYPARVRRFIAKLPGKKEEARKSLASSVTEYCGMPIVLSDLIIKYYGPPPLTPADIDAWDALMVEEDEA